MSVADVLNGAARWALVRGEALTLLRELPDASVDAVVTDPPYSSGGAFRGDRLAATGSKYVINGTHTVRPDFAGDNRDQRSFAYWCVLWLSECLRVSKPGSPVCLFTDWRQLPTVTSALQAGGWVWRGIWVWDKTEGVRPTMGRFSSQCEYVVWGSAGAMPVERGVGVLPGVSRHYCNPAEKHHQTGKPPAVMQELVRIAVGGGIVLDPFAGSASTGVACLREGRRFIGFEITEQYFTIAEARMRAEQDGLDPRAAEAGQAPLFPGAA